VWGLSFKPNTDDIRESRSIALCEKLLKKGCSIVAYDPKVHTTPLSIEIASTIYESTKNADAIIVATEWDMFHLVDWDKVKQTMHGRTILDGRNYLDPKEIKAAGLSYLGVGRP
ncbi:MAG: UDP-glucose/GDP-mannose dehydrogenase family protein, partial [Anaerobacillus sp.]